MLPSARLWPPPPSLLRAPERLRLVLGLLLAAAERPSMHGCGTGSVPVENMQRRGQGRYTLRNLVTIFRVKHLQQRPFLEQGYGWVMDRKEQRTHREHQFRCLVFSAAPGHIRFAVSGSASTWRKKVAAVETIFSEGVTYHQRHHLKRRLPSLHLPLGLLGLFAEDDPSSLVPPTTVLASLLGASEVAAERRWSVSNVLRY